MKNAINYYYGILAEDIHQKDNTYTIITNSGTYALELFDYDPKIAKTIYDLSLNLNNQGIYCHRIMINLEGNYITNINGRLYVLMELKGDFKKVVEIDDLINYSFQIKEISELKNSDWRTLWMNKIDYFEYQINQLGLKYPKVRESSSYFIGIAENGIMLCNEIKNEIIYLSHRRINSNSTYYDLYNPLNFIFDTRVRNAAEYFKSMLINNKKPEIIYYIEKSNLSENELKLLFLRMLYPSFYFDEFENLLKENKDDQRIKKIIDSIDRYELLLTELYDYVSQKTILPAIEWIKK